MNTDKIAFAYYTGSLMSNQMVFAQKRVVYRYNPASASTIFCACARVAQENLLRIAGMLPPNCQRSTKRYKDILFLFQRYLTKNRYS